ncbi:MAG TPA: hypothetical protein VNX68_11990 [Nitrosopumilaceae archaeon]|jgi:hypothetical protein|nr:hypothetical protein [Nitrosopumilaceae archaeon]
MEKNNKKPVPPPIDLIGEMHGDRAVQAPCSFVMARRNQGDIVRTFIGGIILADMCSTENWERWHGTAILIPSRIEKQIYVGHERIDMMVVRYLGLPLANEKESPQYWQKIWEAA